jgi:mRNA interferase MazF
VKVDKTQSVGRKKVGAVFGSLDNETMLAINRALPVFLGFA